MELPRGVRFFPNDEECLFYLKERVSRKPLPFQGMILELNPYAKEQLPDIFAAAEEKDLYFFTRLWRRSNVGQNINHTVDDNGCWRGESRNKKIKDEHGSVIGISRKLIYWDDTGFGKYYKGYHMIEYVLPKDETYDQLKDWVLCRLIKNHRKDGKKVGKSSSNAAANLVSNSTSSSMVADDFCTSKVDATPIHNLPLSVAVETPSHQTLAALEYGYKEILYSLTMAYENMTLLQD